LVKVFTPSGRRVGFWEGLAVTPGIATYSLDLNLANGSYHFVVEIESSGKILAQGAGHFFVLR